MNRTLHISTAVALTAALVCGTVAAAPNTDCDKDAECTTVDGKLGEPALTVAKYELLTHKEATYAYKWYATWFKNKWEGLELVARHDDHFDDLFDPAAGTVDGNDVVDEDPADDDDNWDWLRVLIRILLAAAEHADDIVYNSVYDGTIYSPSNNTSAAAVLQLRRLGTDVTATLWTDVGLVADTRWFVCPDVEVPVGVFPFEATMVPNTLTATGHITKNVSVAGIGAGAVTANFSVEVLSDYEHLVADVAIATPTGCSDTAMTATFTRRIGSEFQ